MSLVHFFPFGGREFFPLPERVANQERMPTENWGGFIDGVKKKAIFSKNT
jgi:hypothetical protein